MQTKIAVVTGASGGLGSELCKLIAAKGINLILVDRNLQKSRAFADTLNSLYPGIIRDTFAVDLANHAEIKQVASKILAKYPTIDFLFNNAGVLTETLQYSGHDNELHFEVNTLAPLQLIDALRSALKRANDAVIVSTSAGLAQRAKELPWDELQKPTIFRKLYGSYINSKQALNVITAALAPDLLQDNIIIRTADPGPNQTRLTKGTGTPAWMRLFYSLLPTPDKGAKKIFNAAFLPKWNNKTGIFISDQKILSLPPALAEEQFQRDFLRRCRERAALM